MSSFIAFFTERGGHGLFLWGSYAMTVAVLAIEAAATRARHRRARAAAQKGAEQRRFDPAQP